MGEAMADGVWSDDESDIWSGSSDDDEGVEVEESRNVAAEESGPCRVEIVRSVQSLSESAWSDESEEDESDDNEFDDVEFTQSPIAAQSTNAQLCGMSTMEGSGSIATRTPSPRIESCATPRDESLECEWGKEPEVSGVPQENEDEETVAGTENVRCPDPNQPSSVPACSNELGPTAEDTEEGGASWLVGLRRLEELRLHGALVHARQREPLRRGSQRTDEHEALHC